MYALKRRRMEEVGCQHRRKDHVCAYYSSNGEERIRVCKMFFMKTLCIGHTLIDTACGDYGTFVGEDHHGKNSHKTKEEVLAVVRAHIEIFLKIESHYMRSDTRGEYLNQLLNISKMYRLYKETFDAATDTPAMKESFYRTLYVRSTKPWLVKQKKLSWKSTVSILNVTMMHNNLKQMTKPYQHVKIILCQQVLTYKVYYN